jgi:hypothetical protein
MGRKGPWPTLTQDRQRRRWTTARRCSTICLPFGQARYGEAVADPPAFRQALARFFREAPAPVPEEFAQGYPLKGRRLSRKRGLPLRRICLKATGETFTVRPSFGRPYMAGRAEGASGPLFLRAFAVPLWAWARLFGRDHASWHRVEVGRGRNSVAGATVRQADVPAHLRADEHHQPRDGAQSYVATTVGAGCGLGAALAQTGGADDREEAYRVFQAAAEDVEPGYAPKTVSAGGGRRRTRSTCGFSSTRLSPPSASISERLVPVWAAKQAIG